MAARTPLIGLAIVAIGGVVGLVLLMSGGDEEVARAASPQTVSASDERETPDPEPEAFPPAESPQEPRADEASEEPKQAPAIPRLPEERAVPSVAGDQERDYVEYRRSDGSIVRDHREGAQEGQPSFGGLADSRQLPPTAEKVRPQTVVAVRDALRPSVRRCAREHAPEAEAGSAVRARVTFSVAAETLTVDDVSTSSIGLPSPGALEGCIESDALGLTLPVAGAEDVEGHPIDLPFRVGPAR